LVKYDQTLDEIEGTIARSVLDIELV